MIGRGKHFIPLLQKGSICQFVRNILNSIHRNDFWPYRRSKLFREGRKIDVPESSTKMNVTHIAPAPAPLHSPLATSPTNLLLRFQPLNAYTKLPMSLTSLAFTFDDEEGIMVAADHLSNSSIVELNSHMLATICGEKAFLLQDLQKMCYLLEQNEGRKTSVAVVLKWLAETLSAYKEEFSTEILIAVWNESEHGLYCMDSRGKLVKDDVIITGCSSASNLLQNILRCDKGKLSLTEAADLAKISICAGASEAPYRGNNFSVYHLGRFGCNKLQEGDLVEQLAIEG